MFRVPEEHVVHIAEAMVRPDLKTIGVVRRAPALDEIASEVAWHRIVRSRRILLEKLLHRSKDQALRNLIAGRTDRLILTPLRVHRQWSARCVAAERISDKSVARSSRRK